MRKYEGLTVEKLVKKIDAVRMMLKLSSVDEPQDDNIDSWQRYDEAQRDNKPLQSMLDELQWELLQRASKMEWTNI